MFLYILYSFYHEVNGRADQTQKGIFLLYWTQNSVCFERSFGLKRCDENFSSISEKEIVTLLHLWTVPGHHGSWLHIPGCSLHGWLGTVEHLQPELVLVCSHLLPNPRLHFNVGDKIFMRTVGLFQKTLACKGSLETSCAQKLTPPGRRGIRCNHRPPAFQIPGPRIQH